MVIKRGAIRTDTLPGLAASPTGVPAGRRCGSRSARDGLEAVLLAVLMLLTAVLVADGPTWALAALSVGGLVMALATMEVTFADDRRGRTTPG